MHSHIFFIIFEQYTFTFFSISGRNKGRQITSKRWLTVLDAS